MLNKNIDFSEFSAVTDRLAYLNRNIFDKSRDYIKLSIENLLWNTFIKYYNKILESEDTQL